jgi:nucleoside-diphosphate-sugar epimerase
MFPLADVRDVASAHLKAMVHPDAAGKSVDADRKLTHL